MKLSDEIKRFAALDEAAKWPADQPSADYYEWADRIAALEASNKELRNELGIDKTNGILTRTANALKGEPAPLHQHSHHDLPEVANELREQLNEAQTTIKSLQGQLER